MSDKQESNQEKPAPTRKEKWLQVLKFTLFSISAGVIQFVSTGVLSTWTGWIPHDYYWVAYLIGLVLSVIWNFTLNRKFTFRSASNVPLAMTLVFLYYCAFTPLSTFGADAINGAWKTAAGAGWNDNFELVITVSMMILNFVTEFLWDKFVVFNDKVINKLLRLFKKEKPLPQENTLNETGKQEDNASEETALANNGSEETTLADDDRNGGTK